MVAFVWPYATAGDHHHGQHKKQQAHPDTEDSSLPDMYKTEHQMFF
jgi:hypothetical protein